MESFFPEFSSYVTAPTCVCVEAVSGQGGRRTGAGAGAGRSRWLWVPGLGSHVIGLPPLDFLPHQPVHVGVCVASQSLILTNRSTLSQTQCLPEIKLHSSCLVRSMCNNIIPFLSVSPP